MKIILSFCFLIEAIILLQYGNSLFTPKYSSAKRIIVVSIFYSLLYIVSLWNVKWLNMILYICVNSIFFITQYTISHRLVIFHSTVLASVMGMCELIVYGIIARITPRFYAQMENFHNTVLFIICSKILFFSIIYLLTHIFKRQQNNEGYHDNSIFMLIIIPFTSIFIMLTFVIIIDNCIIAPKINWMISFSALLILIINLLVFSINQYSQEKYNDYTEMQLLLQKEKYISEYYKMLLSQDENQSILIHDIKKHLQSIEALNEKHDYKRINTYISQLLLSSDLKESSRICENELLNAILARYKRHCENIHISFITDIRVNTINFMADNDVTSLFCNLLDNAIESANGISNSYIEISICKRDKTPFLLITVVNSCLTNPFENKNYNLNTTKSNKSVHGFGIKSIRKVIKQYDGEIKMYYNDKSSTFHTVITLKNKMIMQ